MVIDILLLKINKKLSYSIIIISIILIFISNYCKCSNIVSDSYNGSYPMYHKFKHYYYYYKLLRYILPSFRYDGFIARWLEFRVANSLG